MGCVEKMRVVVVENEGCSVEKIKGRVEKKGL